MASPLTAWCAALWIGCALIASINGHGMVLDPIARGSRWRCNSLALPNYTDNELFCGGFQVQWGTHNGQCGICGDNYGDLRPRRHELGGQFGHGDIVKQYVRGSVIEARVRLTANHRGYFYFDLCNLDGRTEEESCFSQYPLYLVDGSRNWYLPSTEVGEFRVSLKLPESLTCTHCIFRWTYVAGNNWGYCPDGSGKLGCGPQETFKTCSDVRIAAPADINPSFAYCTKAV